MPLTELAIVGNPRALNAAEQHLVLALRQAIEHYSLDAPAA